MPADPNDTRTKRRKAMGDDPNKIVKNDQPLPGSPPGPGNMNSNFNNFAPEKPEPATFSGGNNSPYGDMGLGLTDGRMGGVGATQNSGNRQGNVIGQGFNTWGMDGTPFPNADQQMQMDGQYMMAQASGQTEPGGLNNGLPQSYPIDQLGMAPQSADMGPVPGGFPGTMPSQMPWGTVPVEGMPDATAAVGSLSPRGMTTGKGGGRGRSKTA